MVRYRFIRFAFLTLIAGGCALPKVALEPITIRIATYNIEDVRSIDLLDPSQPRLRRIAEEIAELRPDILLLNEIQYDGEGDPWTAPGVPPGANAKRFIDQFLEATDAAQMGYEAFMAPSNTGIPSGFDLDNDGVVATEVPEIMPGGESGTPGPQTPEGRRYGNDSFGFGMFPGQYGMALLVSRRLQIVRDSVRTFQQFLWSALPDALQPKHPDSTSAWYSEDEWNALRLSSKSHWDVPVRAASGKVIHVLASHPTPPAFDGPEQRNRFRNHDEIRFWGEYLADAGFIVDDRGRSGGLPEGATFVIVGDLNADVDEGSSFENPVQSYLIDNARVNGSFVPLGDRDLEGLRSDDTAWWGLRVDYVLPSVDLKVVGGAVHRHTAVRDDAAHDHFPVWIDVELYD